MPQLIYKRNLFPNIHLFAYTYKSFEDLKQKLYLKYVKKRHNTDTGGNVSVWLRYSKRLSVEIMVYTEGSLAALVDSR